MEIIEIPDCINRVSRANQVSKIIASIVYEKRSRPPDHVEFDRFKGIRLEWYNEYKDDSCASVFIMEDECILFTSATEPTSSFRHENKFNWRSHFGRILNINTEINLNYISSGTASYNIVRTQSHDS